MRFFKIAAISIATLVVLLVAFVGGAIYLTLQPRDVRAAAQRWDHPLSFEEADAAAQELVSQMALDEKLNEMVGSGMGPMITSLLVRGTAAPVYSGGVERLGIPPIAFTDGPRGVISGHSTAFPVSMARAASWDIDLERRIGDAIGKEARAQGANYWGGLCINLVRHPAMGRAEESYGEDPWLMGEMAVAALEGVQRHNVMACAKHFALNSMETARYKVSVEIDERTLREVYLPHFRKVVEHDVASIMSAYNKVRGEWCGENRHLLTTILREEWGFRGFVTSDWIHGLYDGPRGVRAGLDIEMPGAKHYGESLKPLVERGTVAIADIDESVRRIVRTKLQYLSRPDPQAYPLELAASAPHAELAREAAEKSMVLLKNEGALLPLDEAGTKTLAVVGYLSHHDNTGDRGSSNVSPPYTVSPLQGLRNHLGAGAVLHADGSSLDEVKAVAEKSDVVVVIAGTHQDEVGEYITDDAHLRPEGPEEKAPMVVEIPFRDEPLVMSGGDRVPLSLRERDTKVIEAACAANPRCVVGLVGGSVFTMEEWKERVPSILMVWYHGMEGGNALARVLFGEVNPSGKMPLTTPKDESQLPYFDEFADEIEYGYFHGYTLFDEEGHEPAFPFGHGLSYTTWAYANLAVTTPELSPDGRLEVSVDVTNTGERAGEEVVQLYVGFPESAVERPVKLLRAFDKVALGPGETKTVALGVDVEELAWYDPEAGAWKTEPTAYSVLVGPSSRQADLLEARFRIVAN